jgi:glycosyltransferase involved in cell wall biosynthesis
MISEAEQGQASRMLAIGFLPPPLGGVSVSFKIFCDIVAKVGKVDLEVINLSNRRRNQSLLMGSLELFRQMWIQMGRCDVVSLYCATTQIATVGLLTLALCRLRGRPFVLRKAAGLDHRALGPFTGRVAEFVVNHADLFLAQTKHLAELCLGRGVVRTKWFPTSRPLGPLLENNIGECRRFVYVGHVRPSKGAFELVSASERLPESASLDVYGPFLDGINENLFQRGARAEYKGILDPGEVVATLRKYDALVLPSKARSEGYPGVILEAFSVGLPVIATTVGGIPEIVDERCGILVEPGDEEALAHAMRHLISDQAAYQRLCEGARDARERFSAEYWTEWLVQECLQLIKKPARGSEES